MCMVAAPDPSWYSCFLILISGLIFFSGGFVTGSFGYYCLTYLVSIIVVVSTCAFVYLVGLEVFRSFRNATVYEFMRKVEAANAEAALRTYVTGTRLSLGAHGCGGLVLLAACGPCLAVVSRCTPGGTTVHLAAVALLYCCPASS